MQSAFISEAMLPASDLHDLDRVCGDVGLMLDAARYAGSSLPALTVDVATSRIMIVDDEPINFKVACKYLQNAGYQSFITTSDATRALDLLHESMPDVLLLDLIMPNMSGLEILRSVRADHHLSALPVIILTAADDRDLKRTALELGATDFLHKPVDPIDLVPRVRNALAVKSYQDHLRNYAKALESDVRRRTADLEASRLEVIHCLGRAAEFRDNETGRHIIRVGMYVGAIATALGMDEKTVALLEHAAPLHDMGKLGIPDAILLKPGRLDSDEATLMKKHTEYGRRIVASGDNDDWTAFARRRKLEPEYTGRTESPVLRIAASIAATHHEKWDGTGYPLGLAGEAIPIEGRLTAVADVFDALTSRRPYKAAIPVDESLRMMESERGKHFDPRVLDAFFSCIEEILAIKHDLADED